MPSLKGVALVLAADVIWRGLAEGEVGLASCACINPYTHPSLQGPNGIARYLTGNQLVYSPPGSLASYTYPSSYGNLCKSHDDGLPPSCTTSDRPAWCNQDWCYVDPQSCSGVTKTRTKLFPLVGNLYFSYATCAGDGGSFRSDGSWGSEDVQITRQLFSRTDGYARGARLAIESAHAQRNASQVCTLDPGHSMCPCSSCYRSLNWASDVDFTEVGMLQSSRGTPEQKSTAVCMSEQVASNYKAIAAKESDADFQKVGYLYFADQATGSYTQWPKEEACSWSSSSPYDPRFRDWYAAGATGPKDVVIVVDVSGSMGQNGRHELARAATKQILDTLTWKDFASIVLFNNYVSSFYSSLMEPVTEANRAKMKSWADTQVWQSGGTNFRVAMSKALEIIKDSVASGDTCMCSKAIMFLTDGKAEFSESDFEFVQREASKYDIIIFSYTLGSNADTTVPKRLACENRGVYYPVPDGGNLKMVMSEYYHYFVQGQELCAAGFVRYTAVQGHQLYGACMPMYDYSGSSTSLLGVSCLDVNLIADISEMQKQTGWQHFKCQASDSTKMCRALSMSECHRQQLRKAYSEQSVCSDHDYAYATNETACPCQSPSCQDDPEFRDELNYFCDTWVGDDCVNVNTMWGYSEAGMAEVRQKCRRSCGLCPWQDSCQRSSEECNARPVFTECRACLGKVSGTDIEGRPMSCPPDAPRDLMSTTTGTTTCQRGGCGSANMASSGRSIRAASLVSLVLAMVAASVDLPGGRQAPLT